MPENTGIHRADIKVADRIATLMRSLGIDTAHFGTSAPMELATFQSNEPNAMSSLTLLNASRFPIDTLSRMIENLLVFSGDTGLAGEAMQNAKPSISGAEIIEFKDYSTAVWTDMAADHTDRIADKMSDFLSDRNNTRPATRVSKSGRQGSAGGITYNIIGAGPAVLLFPAMLSPSQWEPIIDRLKNDFALIQLGGPHLGAVAIFESRGADASYRRALRGMLDDAGAGPNDHLLEVGCGSGVISRWLAREQLCATPIVSVDLNPFLLNEARSLSEAEGLGDAIIFDQGNAEELPYANNRFDLVLSVTVIEECDADKAITEMIRIVKPGGRVMIKVRACDMPLFWNIPVDPEVKAKAETPIRQVAPAGCADASLMRRMQAAGLTKVVTYPTFHGNAMLAAYYEPISLSLLNENERVAWQSAKSTAIADGSYFVMHPAHCAVGTKPK